MSAEGLLFFIVLAILGLLWLIYKFVVPGKIQSQTKQPAAIKPAIDSRLQSWLSFRYNEMINIEDLKGFDADKVSEVLNLMIGEDITKHLMDTEQGCSQMTDMLNALIPDDERTRLTVQFLTNLYVEAANEVLGTPDDISDIFSFLMLQIPTSKYEKDCADLIFANIMAFATLANHRLSGRITSDNTDIYVFQTAFINSLKSAKKNNCRR